MKNNKTLIKKIITKIRIGVTLVLLRILKLKLIISKKLRRLSDPIIHIYTICWNEEKFLPFFLDHYGSFCEKIIVYDNESTDSTLDILAQNPKIEVITYKTGGTFNDIAKNKISNTCWKRSRGKADYVIVCDLDELLYAKTGDIKSILKQTNKTVFRPVGYEMMSENFPLYNKPLREQCKGLFSEYYCKKIIFDPHCIVDINYYPGCHEADPRGFVKTGTSEFLLLHYKRLGVDYVVNRYRAFEARLSQQNIDNKMGLHYRMTEKEITDELTRMLAAAKEI